MKSSLNRTLLISALVALSAYAFSCVAAETKDAQRIEAEIEDVREQLDAAARQLGELHQELYQAQTMATRMKPMLGVLLGGEADDGGLKVVGVTPGSGAAEAGLKSGDRLLAVNGFRLDASEPHQALKDGMEGTSVGDVIDASGG